jgi:hypothetical protein
MSAMDMDALTAAFKGHTEGQEKFTRRMAIVLADMDGTTPKQLVLRCERLGLLKPGSWEWFKDNGGITDEQVKEVRIDRDRCPYCVDGVRTGLPGNACENCMNTGLRNPPILSNDQKDAVR